MKVLVPVKRVVDYEQRIRVKADETGVETANVKMSMNPFDEIALEEAIRLHEAQVETGGSVEIIVVSIGVPQCRQTMQTALAMGADRGIHVVTENELEPLAVAKILTALTEREGVDLVIAGKQAIDDDSNQTGQMLAALLGWPQGTFVSDLELVDGGVRVAREVDGGLETIGTTLPAVLTTDLRLNVPRFIPLPNIMRAKKKPVEELTPDALGVDATPRTATVKVQAPPVRQAGVRVGTVVELVEKLRNDAKVIP